MRNIKYIKQNEVIHCPTIEVAKEILKLAHKAGFGWNDGESFLKDNKWDVYRENTCYYIREGMYGSKPYYEKNKPDHVMVDYNEFLSEFNEDLCERLKKGEVALHYNNKNLEQLNKILGYCFKNSTRAEGTQIYYMKGFINWTGDDNPNGKYVHKIEEFFQSNITHMKTYKITRSQFEQIHKIACSYWKQKIEELTKQTLGSFGFEGEIDHDDVKNMFEAADIHQTKLLKTIFPDYNKLIIPKGQWAWVKDSGHIWEARVSDGNGRFYNDQQRSGNTKLWENVRPFDQIPF